MDTKNSIGKKTFLSLPFNPTKLVISLLGVLAISLSGCLAEPPDDGNVVITTYQQIIAEKSPQLRPGQTGLDSLKPPADPNATGLRITVDRPGGTKLVDMALPEAVMRALASSPEISVVSFDPSIARENITRAVAEFDVTAFGQVNYDKQDNPINIAFQPGLSDTRLWSAGIKQKATTGAEWSASYALTRNWDDLASRPIHTRYEPMMTFQIKQPLLRDGWRDLNLAGVNIARLNYRIALASFRKITEDVAAEITALYWTLTQARQDIVIQEKLLQKSYETLNKVLDRKNIDATTVQIKQAESAVKTRQAVLFQVKKQLFDVQDALVRLLSDSQINLLDDFELVPTTALDTSQTQFDRLGALDLAMANNPDIQQRRLAVEAAQINVDVAKRQKMPRLDLVASAKMTGLDRRTGSAHDQIIKDNQYASHAVGVTFEYPLGNRQRQAEFRRRLLERSKAVSTLQNVSDQVATAVKEKIRLARTSYDQIQVQKEAVDAARLHLRALEDTETIREKLTPEFLLVKLQAQESLANAERAHIKAVADYNTALVRLAQVTGTVLDMRHIKPALPQPPETNTETQPPDPNQIMANNQ